ncbi:hypothetical protein Tco_0937950 [Tanacetum coccineum]|uniref:Uncharacterized protein n=1 Tax=Tanacetum coccineum TaxID=301880 RepID=A0ABQ5DFQ8_9ASTR
MIEEIDQDAGITLVTPTHSQEDQPGDQLGVHSVAKVLADTTKKYVNTYTKRRRAVSTAVKDKGKGIMTESEDEQTKRTKIQLEQERLDHEATEDIRSRLKADEELSRRLHAEERNKYSEVDQAKMLVDLINQRKKYFAAQKAKTKRNKPMTQAQQRNYMINYIKHMGSHTLQQLKRYSFDELKELFETAMKNVNAFIPIETEDRKGASELADGSSQAIIIDSAEVVSSKRDAEVELDHEGSKKQKTNEASGLNIQSLTGKFTLNNLENIGRSSGLRLFEPNTDDTLWKLQRYMHDPLKWRLYDTFRVHHVSTERGMDIFMLVEKEYPLSKGVLMLMLVNKLLVEQSSEMANELLRKIFIQANRPRQ